MQNTKRTVNGMAEKELFGKSEQLDDLISRAAVVDEIEGVDWYHINRNGEMVHGANDAEHQAWYKADDIYAAIERVPSAVPVAKDTNVPVKDCISRQAALDALGEEPLVWHEDDAGEIAERNQWRRDVAAIKALPSAQQWISCKERLPKDYESVNVTVRIPEGRYVKESAFLNGVWIGVSAPAEVVAWCPLPEPWKGEQE